MIQNLPELVIVIPLITAFLVTAVAWLERKLCFFVAAAGLLGSLVAAAALLARVAREGVVVYNLGNWMPPWGISYRVDALNGIVLVAVTAVAFVNAIGTRQLVSQSYGDRLGAFYALYILFVTGVAGIVLTGDAFNLYVLIEIAAITGYALIGLGDGRAALSSLNYIFMGTIGASFYLLGVGYLYLATGSLNMADLANQLAPLHESRIVMSAFIIAATGLFIKMGLFPFHAWLPNAYSDAPSPVGSLVAPLMTKVMVYVMIRIVLFVFTPEYAFSVVHLAPLLTWLAVAAIVAGSLLALSTRSLKRMLTYIIVAEVGYMVGGFWLGNRAGISGAILHIVNDAAMTFCVFLAAGIIIDRVKSDRIEDLQGLFRKMPVTMGALAIAGFSIIGVPPTCGFFSKWYLLSGGLAAGHWGYVVALLFSSLVNVVLFFRVFEIAYFEPFSDHHGHGGHAVAIEEASVQVLVPLAVTAVILVVLGFYSGDIVTKLIDAVIPAGII
ncbi:MAG: complex I subunit 5 family protein [Desulfobacterales bacterium]